MKNNLFSPLSIILACIFLFLASCNPKNGQDKKKPAQSSKEYHFPAEKPLPDLSEDASKNPQYSDPASAPVLSRLAKKEIIYTKHARCRMGCRHIDEREVKDALYTGHINDRKSNLKDTPCPTYAIETRSPDGQLVRIVFADCDNVTKVITVIDLETEFQCDCK